ncbi:type VI secretion system baseplate subunit TssE [Yoonia sediminilitoris]|uniref:Type VI secretion system protein ImpF n=1 Tax=Yoonia sediminilitoris TaxID=1286148 RepID=A0A2T6KM42_9RHOB|nr:type VI secretion system baseplate subunit TssE [Yoonia sediminilitoris]PUB17273.1 type VI secretion system protein ImpF [Yoonia sediminilitoris]RCW97568.1 type VI secretion system protein ImpF [Yoonia sediminilitoris]
MSQFSGPGTVRQARSEAIQPSLWDRLINDMPGLEAEIDSLRRELIKVLGSHEKLDSLVADGTRAVEADPSLTDDTKRQIYLLTTNLRRHHALQESGIMVTRDVLREAVRRDIETLFNIERMAADTMMTDHEAATTETPEELLADFPHVRRSVINYGVPSFSGRSGSDFDKNELARDLKQVLTVFEPRLKPNTIKVGIDLSDKTGMKITVDAVLMLSPTPERLKLSTTIDLDNGVAATMFEDD